MVGSMDDLVITYFISGTDSTTLPVFIFSMVRRHSGNASLEVAVRGAPGELVALAFAPPARTSGAWAAAVVECTVPSSGALVVAVPERSCVL